MRVVLDGFIPVTHVPAQRRRMVIAIVVERLDWLGCLSGRLWTIQHDATRARLPSAFDGERSAFVRCRGRVSVVPGPVTYSTTLLSCRRTRSLRTAAVCDGHPSSAVVRACLARSSAWFGRGNLVNSLDLDLVAGGDSGSEELTTGSM